MSKEFWEFIESEAPSLDEVFPKNYQDIPEPKEGQRNKKRQGQAVKLQAIETVYNGYRFRSRLEARWAVFFDTLGVKYEYEKEGFNLDGIWYLPDFWLPGKKYWVEVKPIPPNKLELEKAERLALASHYPVFFHLTIPQSEPDEEIEEGVFLRSNILSPTLWGVTPIPSLGPDDKTGILFDDGALLWTECPICRQVGIALWGANDCLPCGCIPFDSKLSATYSHPRHNSSSPRLIAAYTAARQARFEHGETPLIPKVDTKGICCQSCRKLIEQVGGRGHRPRLFCSDRCRQQAHREEKRKQLETLIALETDITTRLATLEKQVLTSRKPTSEA